MFARLQVAGEENRCKSGRSFGGDKEKLYRYLSTLQLFEAPLRLFPCNVPCSMLRFPSQQSSTIEDMLLSCLVLTSFFLLTLLPPFCDMDKYCDQQEQISRNVNKPSECNAHTTHHRGFARRCSHGRSHPPVEWQPWTAFLSSLGRREYLIR